MENLVSNILFSLIFTTRTDLVDFLGRQMIGAIELKHFPVFSTIWANHRWPAIRDVAETFRVLYVAKFDDAVYVLHCFQKKTQRKRAKRSEPSRAALPRFVEGARSMSKKRFANVWDAIEDTPALAENMKLRSALIMALKDHIARTGLSQSEAAKLLGVTQPRISDLMRGKIELFGLDTLVNMIGAAGLHVEMRISDAA
jgi:predicted XRE-type DNA-binding protein